MEPETAPTEPDVEPEAATVEPAGEIAEVEAEQRIGIDDAGAPDTSGLDYTAPALEAESVDMAPADGVFEPSAGGPPAGFWPEAQEGALSLAAALESLLFVAEGPIEPAQLARVLGLDADAVSAGLLELEAYYRQHARGLRVQTRNGRFQLVTAPAAAALIENLLNLDTSTRLSGPALETLAVIAYRQPVTRAQIEAVRGVDCSGVLRSLLQRGLVEEVGRLDTPGRPVLYAITDLFMHHFGLTGLHELPPLATSDVERIDEALQAGDVAA